MYVHSVFVLSCVQVAALRRADPPSKEPYRLCIWLRIRESYQDPTNGYRAIDGDGDDDTHWLSNYDIQTVS
jgi:hypothetical protein